MLKGYLLANIDDTQRTAANTAGATDPRTQRGW
jgi:hypothetical protein